MLNTGRNHSLTMSKEHVTFLKAGGFMKITEYSEKEKDAKEHRDQRIWMKEEGLLAIDEPDIKQRWKEYHPFNTDTEMKQYAPSRSLKARLTVFLRNHSILQWEWSL